MDSNKGPESQSLQDRTKIITHKTHPDILYQSLFSGYDPDVYRRVRTQNKYDKLSNSGYNKLVLISNPALLFQVVNPDNLEV